jgi:dTDP-glucose 4,6-dehydratase
MPKILVTGTSGFIYTNFIRKMTYEQHNKPIEERYTFASIDRVNYGSSTAIYFNKSHNFYPADIRDAHIVDTIFALEKPDYVIHGAAESSVDASFRDPNSFMTSNVLGTQVIINACAKHNIKKLILASTDEVYGQLTNENDPLWTEESPTNPRNFYAASKLCSEILVQTAGIVNGLNYNIVRSSNNWGPRQQPDKLIPKVIKCVLEGQKIPIHGQGNYIRDWLYVMDNVFGIMCVLEKGAPNETYNIGANQEFSNLEVVYEICKYLGTGQDLIEFVPDPRGKWQDFRYGMSSAKLKTLGWKTTAQFKKDLGPNCIQFYLDNKWSLL